MTDPATRFAEAFAACPLVAVLRGLTPDEAAPIGDALVDAGFTLLEVPLNSPDPLASIAELAKRYAGRAIVGAGTVLSPQDVAAVADAGGALIVSPNTDPAVIRASVERGLISLPGYFTPSEAFAALHAGAHGLKLFPAEGAAPAFLKAQRAVLPKATKVLAVGGITPDTMPQWHAAGTDGFGLGSNLYRAGKSAADVARDAAAFVQAAKDLA
ncbi:2-dehydro-3-deoxy-6-phosphogalactonate aldolase [uncultured Sphingomonas sp.]|uniref:2-dehydro-3-deoxy-6-phosphogalactonate aldolase n=1 Tax=uncultured Sphingomonas sp. TaxID=158754 RepID=UPI0025CC6299|nr:2-dehydro-3-deoxy-6-phosphogalactonate aldolase [uncultured Sphingomonas sp.]